MADDDASDEDSFLGEDIGYPNRKAQYRGFRFMLFLFLLVGIVAVAAGLSESARDMIAAFPTSSSLLEGAAWAKFFGALGHLTIIGLAIVFVVLVWRWRHRRAVARRTR